MAWGCHIKYLGILSTLVQIMAWCHQAPCHYLNQCWHIINCTLNSEQFQWNDFLSSTTLLEQTDPCETPSDQHHISRSHMASQNSKIIWDLFGYIRKPLNYSNGQGLLLSTFIRLQQCHMSIMASQITRLLTVWSKACWNKYQTIIKTLHYWPLVRGTTSD